MTELVLAHTGQLPPLVLAEARDLLQRAFEGDLRDEDWEHCLGGMHALLRQDGELVAHGALVTRRLLHRGRALRTGYVEGVVVRADVRRRGHGSTVMAALEDLALRAHDLAALAATDAGAAFYAARRWLPWQGPTAALTPSGIVRTPEEDSVFVLPLAVELDRTGQLTCDWRDGDLW